MTSRNDMYEAIESNTANYVVYDLWRFYLCFGIENLLDQSLATFDGGFTNFEIGNKAHQKLRLTVIIKDIELCMAIHNRKANKAVIKELAEIIMAEYVKNAMNEHAQIQEENQKVVQELDNAISDTDTDVQIKVIDCYGVIFNEVMSKKKAIQTFLDFMRGCQYIIIDGITYYPKKMLNVI